MKVLLADDDPDIRDLTAHRFGRRGWTVVTATTGEEALAELDAQQFDVVVLDQNMPPGSGLEVAAARRQAGDRVPIVLWTGWAGLVGGAEAERLEVHVLNKSDVSQLTDLVAELAGQA
jgi:two-component system response regulator GlrR